MSTKELATEEIITIPVPVFKPGQKVFDLATENVLEGKEFTDKIYTISRCLWDYEEGRWYYIKAEDSEQEPYTEATFVEANDYDKWQKPKWYSPDSQVAQAVANIEIYFNRSNLESLKENTINVLKNRCNYFINAPYWVGYVSRFDAEKTIKENESIKEQNLRQLEILKKSVKKLKNAQDIKTWANEVLHLVHHIPL